MGELVEQQLVRSTPLERTIVYWLAPERELVPLGSLLTTLGATVPQMKQSIVHVALIIKDYDEAIAFYTQKLRFVLLEDTYQPEQDKRWVVVAPPSGSGATLVLARAATPEQEAFIGNQAGGRVFLFLTRCHDHNARRHHRAYPHV